MPTQPKKHDPMSKLASARPPVQTILLVDDEPDILESLADVLSLHLPGVTLIKASSGKAALEVLARQAVGLIVSDYRMPSMDGLEFLTLARKTAPSTPRILITAYPELGVAVRAINEAQIQNFIAKPIAPLALIEVINAALLKARKESQRMANASSMAAPAIRYH